MILQRLCEAACHFDFPPPGYQEGPITWIVEVSEDGRKAHFVRTTGGTRGRGKDRGKRMWHPFVARTSGVGAQLLADRASYALGVRSPEATAEQVERAAQCQRAFADLVAECAQATGLPQVHAVTRFLSEGLGQCALPDDLEPADTVAFSVDGHPLIELAPVRDYWADRTSATRQTRKGDVGTCLVCGEVKPLADRMPIPIKPIRGGQKSGCQIVSANAAAYESYGRSASLISPICWDCGQRHAEVLNKLLTTEGYQFHLSDLATYVFWTREPSDFSPATFLTQPTADDVKRLMESVYRPSSETVPDTEAFYGLAVSGSGGRVVIRDWFETTLASVKRKLLRYFDAQQVVANDGSAGEPLGVYALMGALIPSKGRDPWKHLPPNLIAQTVRAALLGTPLPDTLLSRAVARARVEHRDGDNPTRLVLTRPRAAVIKMALLLSTHREEALQVTPELNAETCDSAYLCGRLLAILENLQEAAAPGIKATIVDRYYGTASTAPASVFGNLMRLAQSHLGKLRKTNEGAHFRLQLALEGVAGRLTEFPRTLQLVQQGKFALGYYQQRAADRAARTEAIAAKKAKAAAEAGDQEDE